MPRSLVVLFALIAACHGGAPSRFPAREPGCEVRVFPDAPNVQTENIGTVTATCDDTLPAASCTRTLQDEACKLGADVVWGVGDPTKENGKTKLAGRAAHTK